MGSDTDDTRQVLQEAGQLGADFLDFLLGDGLVHADRPIHFGRDPRETKHSLARLFLPAWRSTPGALAWARKVLRVPLGDQLTEMLFPRNELLELPPRNVTWQVGLRLLDEDEPMSGEVPVWILGIVALPTASEFTSKKLSQRARATRSGRRSAVLCPGSGDAVFGA